MFLIIAVSTRQYFNNTTCSVIYDGLAILLWFIGKFTGNTMHKIFTLVLQDSVSITYISTFLCT